MNNKDVVDLTALSPNVIQIFAKKPGVTQVNLWDEKNQIHTIDVVVFGDARELSLVLQQQFPNATITVRPSANSVILSGFVPEPDQAAQIQQIAQDYYPKVVSLLKVGGVQQILLHVKVMEVSRTKLRELGFDFWTNNKSFFVASSPSGLLNTSAAAGQTVGSFGAPATSAAGDSIRFGVAGDSASFFGFIDALRQYQLAKVMAEPTIVTVSGRPAYFNSGGEFPILIPSGLGTVSVDFKKFGTQVDFVPLVLGNGSIRLDVKPRISFLRQHAQRHHGARDHRAGPQSFARSIPRSRNEGPARRWQSPAWCRTGWNTAMPAFPTCPICRISAPCSARFTRKTTKSSWSSWSPFRNWSVSMDACDVPPCGPGMASREPNDCELYWKGHAEIPSCGPCSANDCLWGGEGNGNGMSAAPEAVPTPAPAPKWQIRRTRTVSMASRS